MGPGSDPDSIRELHSGAVLLWEHRYVLSRPPGYFPYETLCGLLYFLGGAVATNCATVAMSLLLLDSFLRVCERLTVPHRHLLATAMAIHPIYWASSTSTIDFIWALGCFLVGFRLVLDHRYIGAAVMLGLSVGIRLSSALMVAPLLVSEIIARPRDARVWITAALASAIGAALYFPEFIASEIPSRSSLITSVHGRGRNKPRASSIRMSIFGACRRRSFSALLRRRAFVRSPAPNPGCARPSSCR